jgi:hypothetical protein
MSLRNAVYLIVLGFALSTVSPTPAQTPKAKAAPKADASTLAAAHGVVLKVDADSITVRPRGADGWFDKELGLTVTGTITETVLAIQTRGGKPVAVQTDSDAKSLQPQQEMAVIAAQVGDGWVLLSTVAMSSGK